MTPTSTTELGVRRRRPRPAGFTLVELLVVLAIAAAAVSVVGVRGAAWLERAAYHEAVQHVATGLARARGDAVHSGIDVAVWWDAPSQRLIVEGSGRREIDIPASVTVQAEALPTRDLALAQRPHTLLFVFRGSGAGRGGALQLVYASQGTRFSINWALGVVERQSVVVEDA